MKKYTAALLLSGALILSLWGCGEQKETSGVQKSQAEMQLSSSEQDSSSEQIPSMEQVSSVPAPAAEENTPASANIPENTDEQKSTLSDIPDTSNDKSVLKETGRSFEEILADVEDMAKELDASILNDLLTQAEYNEKTLELYELWDFALNALWDTLKQTLDSETMETLTAEEREWVSQKEEAVEKAGEEFEGGSMQPMIRNQTAADMTKERVYELMELYLEP